VRDHVRSHTGVMDAGTPIRDRRDCRAQCCGAKYWKPAATRKFGPSIGDKALGGALRQRCYVSGRRTHRGFGPMSDTQARPVGLHSRVIMSAVRPIAGGLGLSVIWTSGRNPCDPSGKKQGWRTAKLGQGTNGALPDAWNVGLSVGGSLRKTWLRDVSVHCSGGGVDGYPRLIGIVKIK